MESSIFKDARDLYDFFKPDNINYGDYRNFIDKMRYCPLQGFRYSVSISHYQDNNDKIEEVFHYFFSNKREYKIKFNEIHRESLIYLNVDYDSSNENERRFVLCVDISNIGFDGTRCGIYHHAFDLRKNEDIVSILKNEFKKSLINFEI